MPQSTLTLRPELAAELDELAARAGRLAADLANEAVTKYLDYERWAFERVAEGVRQADEGEFASEDEVARVFDKYRTRATSA